MENSRVITYCYEIHGYNYSKENPGEGYSWTEPAGCTSVYIPDEGYTDTPTSDNYAQLEGGASGGGGNSNYPHKHPHDTPGKRRHQQL